MDRVSERLRDEPDWYIGRDPDDETKVAVWEVPASGHGTHRIVEQGFNDRHEALGWIRYNGRQHRREG